MKNITNDITSTNMSKPKEINIYVMRNIILVINDAFHPKSLINCLIGSDFMW